MLLRDSRVLAAVQVAEPRPVAVDVEELEVRQSVESFLLADRSLGRLDGCGVRNTTAVVRELDPSGQRFRDDAGSALGGNATELDACGQHEDVGRKAVPALMRRDPELVVAEVFREPRIDGGATQRAAGVARPMPADEDER